MGAIGKEYLYAGNKKSETTNIKILTYKKSRLNLLKSNLI